MRQLGGAAGNVNLITDVQIPIRQMDDGDAYPVEIIRHDADLFFNGTALGLQAREDTNAPAGLWRGRKVVRHAAPGGMIRLPEKPEGSDDSNR